MLKLLALVLKGALFALVVLVLGNWIRIGNHTVSDQVKTEVAHAENSAAAEKIRDLAGQVADDLRSGHRKKVEAIPSSERQKLKDLMRELNSQSAAN